MELKPCPFCGVRPELRQHPICDIIECENPHCPVSLSILQEHPRGDHQKAHMLVAAWNTRAERTCRVESLHGYTDPFASTRYSVELSCHTLEDWPDSEPPEYCPWCGAKVVG